MMLDAAVRETANATVPVAQDDAGKVHATAP